MVPCGVVILKDPDARTATRPTYLPAFLPAGTTACTKSPVLKSWTQLCCFARVRGNPAALMRHICRRCQPFALISSGETRLIHKRGGVLAPQHAASNQWVFGSPCWCLFHLVLPPVPVSTGTPVAQSSWYNRQRVLLTAAASRRGTLACASTSG